jgi:predicted phosphoadenosine phosphosulfate sulfurtransferase
MKYWKEEDDKTIAKGINFDEYIKSWKKLPMIQWSGENIWHIVAKQALKLSTVFTKIYIEKIHSVFKC